MDDQEVGIEHARKILGDLAMDARDEGRITFLTLYGRVVAAIVPRHIAEQALNQHKQENP